ncbi:hypothetical protein AB6A40_009524 [Gnathostoma spinigerum]|uniref:Neurofibromin n=1 Tax=Gnathostoma spinigerum TaxID=75299 RepID=A0ABD6F1Q8_9BILA
MFSFVVGNSACEPVTPFRLALYLLIQTLDSHHRLFPFTSKQLVMLSSVVFALLRAVNLSYVELCSALQTALGYVDKELFVKFKKRSLLKLF